ncbi:MAG: DUF4129 domain-containing protein, partial [Thermoplasmata archaeon]|nr:DUF4129 domain-containing protein [Thermoplasmata archaeon]
KTDPLRVDSDGDGIWDGLEVKAGSSPTDGSDTPSSSNGNSRDPIRPNPDPVWPDPGDPGYDPNTHDPNQPDPFSPTNPTNPGNSNIGSSGDLTRMLPLIVGVILIIIIFLYYISWRRQHIEEIAEVAEETEIRLIGIKEEEIDSIRKAIFEAYRSMLKVMRKYDYVREKSMTPLEFQKVIEAAIPISDKNLSELTKIFEEARYSNHKLDTRIRDRAILCFRDLKNELRGIKWSQKLEEEAKSETAIAG